MSGSTTIEKNDTVDSKESAKIDLVEDVKDSSVSSTSTIDEDKLLRKLDWHLLPFFSILYLLSFLDSKS